MFRLFLGILKPRRPIIGGVEFSGRVVEVGKSVSRFKVKSRKRMLRGFGGDSLRAEGLRFAIR